MKKAAIFFAALLGIFTLWYYRQHPLTTRIKLHDQIFFVELAVTPSEKERGLGYRDNLEAGHGMLFPYDRKDQYSFWMKGMRFPIDILWMDERTVVDITANVPVTISEPLPVYQPKVPVDKVLELPAGTAQRAGIAIGDTMEILR